MDSTATRCLELQVLGAGRVGLNMARLAAAKGMSVACWSYGPMAPENRAAAERAGIQVVESGQPPPLKAQALLLAIPDTAVLPTLSTLRFEGELRPPILVTSGSVPLPDSAAGAPVGRFHAPFSFPTPLLDLETVQKALVMLAGSPEAVDAGIQLACRLGLSWVSAAELDPTLYHAACVLASNIVPVCLDAAAQCLRAAGVPEIAHAAVLQSLLFRPLRELPQSASELTGPATRGDAATLLREADALRQHLPELEALFRSGNALIARLTGRPDVVDALEEL